LLHEPLVQMTAELQDEDIGIGITALLESVLSEDEKRRKCYVLAATLRAMYAALEFSPLEELRRDAVS